MLTIQQRDNAPHAFRLRLHAARTGELVASFTCRVPGNNVWWIISADAKTTAFVTYDAGDAEKPRVEWHDIRSGRLLHTLEDFREPIRFSKDGSRFAATRVRTQANGKFETTISVWEVPSGRELARFIRHDVSSDTNWPNQFSPDGKLLLDSHCTVWDVARGQKRFEVPGIYYNSMMFTPEGRYLAVVAKSESNSWLAFHDVETGEEHLDRRVPLTSGESPGMHLGRATPDGRLLFATGTPRTAHAGVFHRLLAHLPGLGHLGQDRHEDEFVLIDAATAQEVARGVTGMWSCTPDGRYILSRSRDEVYQLWDYQLWDMPPSKPLRWLLR